MLIMNLVYYILAISFISIASTIILKSNLSAISSILLIMFIAGSGFQLTNMLISL